MGFNKLDLLKKYISVQAHDESLWFIAQSATEAYLQDELRKLAYLIEEANNLEILKAINEKRISM